MRHTNPRSAQSNLRSLALALAICAASFLFAQSIHAQSVWGETAAGTYPWSTAGNWASGGIPNAIDAIADFSQVNMAGSQIVTVSSDTVGTLIYGDTGSTPASWTNTGTSLTLATSTGTPTITVDALVGSSAVTISSAIHATNGFIKAGPGPLIITGTFLYVSNNVTIKQGMVTLTGADSSTANGVTNITLGDPLGGSASLNFAAQVGTFLSAVTLATNAVGTLAIGQTAGHNAYAGAITLNGNNLTVLNTSTSSSAGLLVSAGITGVGNVTFENDNGGGTANFIRGSSVPINYSGILVLTGNAVTTATANAVLSGVGPNVTNIYFDTVSQPMVIDNLTNGANNLMLTNTSTGTATIAGWSGSGSLTFYANNSGSFAIGNMTNFTGNISNSGTGSGTNTMGILTNTASSVTQNSASSELVMTASGNTYGGGTFINAGTLALTTGATNGPSSAGPVSIAAGATLDASLESSATYTFAGTGIIASGTGTTVGSTAATINGASGGTVVLGSVPITLAYDGSDPALYISQGTLSLGGNAFTVNGSPLAVGTYPIVQQASGSIMASNTVAFPAVSGTAIGAGTTGAISVAGGIVSLVVSSGSAPPPPAVITSLVQSGGNLVMVWQGGTNQSCVLLTTTNIALPVADWTPVTTNTVGANGLSTNTIPVNPSQPHQFFLLNIP